MRLLNSPAGITYAPHWTLIPTPCCRNARGCRASELLVMGGGKQSRGRLRDYGFASYIKSLPAPARAARGHDLLPHIRIGNETKDEFPTARCGGCRPPELSMTAAVAVATKARRMVAHG